MKARNFVCSAALVLLAAACGGGGGGEAAPETTISSAVPSDVVLSSPTASIAGSASISAVKAEGDPPADKPGDPVADDFASKREALNALITGEGECAFTLQMPQVTEPDCYGPRIDYVNHPDVGGVPPGPNGQLPPLDTGFWNETQGATEACAAAKMNALIDKVASKVDNMVKIFGAMACAGKKADVDPPAVNALVDLKDEMGANVGVDGLTIDSATIERLADDSDGNSVYLSTIETTMSFPDGQSSSGRIILKHIPTAADNTTYKGKLSVKMSFANVGGCGEGVEGQGAGVLAGTVLYSKASESAVVYEFNFADFCGADTDPFDGNNNIDKTDKYDPASNPDGWVHNWNYGLFSLNPSNGTGSVAYAWQAGAQDQRTRVLDVTVTPADDGSASGTAYYGFGPDVANSGLGSIDGFVCNWAGPGGAISVMDRSAENLLAVGKGVDKAQKQILTRAAGATEFTTTPADSFIKYAITNTCEAGAGGNFTYQAILGDGSHPGYSNDRTTTIEAVVSELIDRTIIDFVTPTPPTDL